MIYHRVHVVPDEFVQPPVLDCVTPLGKISVLISAFVIVAKLNGEGNPVIADRSSIAPVFFVIEVLFTHAGNDVAFPVRLMRVSLLAICPVIASTVAAESVPFAPVFVLAVKVTKLGVLLKNHPPIDVTAVSPLRLTLIREVHPTKNLSLIDVSEVNALRSMLVNPPQL